MCVTWQLISWHMTLGIWGLDEQKWLVPQIHRKLLCQFTWVYWEMVLIYDWFKPIFSLWHIRIMMVSVLRRPTQNNSCSLPIKLRNQLCVPCKLFQWNNWAANCRIYPVITSCISVRVRHFPYSGLAHRVFIHQVLRSCVSPLCTPISFVSFCVTYSTSVLFFSFLGIHAFAYVCHNSPCSDFFCPDLLNPSQHSHLCYF